MMFYDFPEFKELASKVLDFKCDLDNKELPVTGRVVIVNAEKYGRLFKIAERDKLDSLYGIRIVWIDPRLTMAAY